jgi:hypothetical protein
VRHRIGGNIGARARPIFDNELLAELLRQPLRDQPRDDVGRGAGRKADDDARRTFRVIERPVRRERASPGRLCPCTNVNIAGGKLSWCLANLHELRFGV